jgi:hypothetical protein
MDRTKHVVYFESDPDKIKSSGDNSGYIYNPTALFYNGEPFTIQPGETVLFIPCQPDYLGPWKQRHLAFEETKFLQCKEEETLALIIYNRCPNKIHKISPNSCLDEILYCWGISHEKCFVTDHQMEKIEAFHNITATPWKCTRDS